MPQMAAGVWPAMPTPVDENRQVNLDATGQLVDALITEGTDGIYLLGATGQGLALRLAQRQAVAERACAKAAGRVPVIVHVGCINTDDAVELARHAAGCGAAGISAIPPVYFGNDLATEMKHYGAIASATSLPFFPYINTMATGEPPVAPKQYVEALLELPHITGSKITTRNLYTLGLIHHYAQDKLKLYSGADELMCHAVLCGAYGAIGSFYNIWGSVARRARQACVEGQMGRVQHFMGVFQGTLDEILASGSAYKFIRQAIHLRHDVDIGPGSVAGNTLGPEWNKADVQRLLDVVDRAA